jgi:hypothetical protein
MSSASASVILSEVQRLSGEILSLKSQVTSLQTLLSSKAVAAEPSGSVSGKKAKKEKKEKDPNAPKRERTEWGLFTDKIRALLKENGYSGMDLAVGCLQFCKALKTENEDLSSWASEDVLARRSAWTAPEPKAKKEGSVASGPAEEDELDGAASAASSEKKKRGPAKGTKLTDEQKAARKATREANKAKKEGSSEAPASPKAAPTSVAPASPKAAPAPAPASADPSDEFKPTLLGGKKYFINLKTGHAYHRNDDGSQGEWAGLFSRIPKPHIDFDAPEPTEEEGDDLCLDE